MANFLKYVRKATLILEFLLCCIIITVLLVPYFNKFNGELSDDINDWSGFAAYASLSISLISFVFLFLTYKSQKELSSVLQFESVFFQWLQQQRALYSNVKCEINELSNNTVIKLIRENKDEFHISYFQNEIDNGKLRSIMVYYRHLYQLLKYIYLSDIIVKDKQKKKYYDIIQSHMNDDELYVVLFILLGDKKKNEKKALTGISYLQLLDQAHIFKNIYYSDKEKNYDKFVTFMHNTFPNTIKSKSFYFLEKKAVQI